MSSQKQIIRSLAELGYLIQRGDELIQQYRAIPIEHRRVGPHPPPALAQPIPPELKIERVPHLDRDRILDQIADNVEEQRRVRDEIRRLELEEVEVQDVG